MKKDQADEFQQELLQPLATALRTTLGDAGQVHVNNEPRLMTGNRVEYETWLVLRFYAAASYPQLVVAPPIAAIELCCATTQFVASRPSSL
jgi:hypothetical protein